VYSATERHPAGKFLYYYPHTGYQIYTTDGKRFKYVDNHVGLNDDSPMVVRLPSGRYRIVVESDDYGRVVVPVVIRWRELTQVDLESRGRRKGLATNSENMVTLPDGYTVGWPADGAAK
jgi:hypothetical protein